MHHPSIKKSLNNFTHAYFGLSDFCHTKKGMRQGMDVSQDRCWIVISQNIWSFFRKNLRKGFYPMWCVHIIMIDFCKKICSSHNKILLTLDRNEKSDQGHWTCATLIWETIMSTIMDNGHVMTAFSKLSQIIGRFG